MRIVAATPDDKPEPELKLWLERYGSDVALCGQLNGGQKWYILTIEKDGVHLDTSADELGLPVDAEGRVLVHKD